MLLMLMKHEYSEKFKVRISRYCFLVLLNDCQAFGSVNKKEAPNICGLLNKLMPTLVKQREKRQTLIHSKLAESEMLKSESNSYEEKTREYLDTIYDQVYFGDYLSETLSESVWIRPNRETLLFFERITGQVIEKSQMDLSKYLRSLIVEYCSMPQFKREQLYFKKEIDSIELAISHGNALMVKRSSDKEEIIPITMAAEFTWEQKNYLMALENKRQGKVLSLPLGTFIPLYEDKIVGSPAEDQLNFIEKLIDDGALGTKEEFDIEEETKNVLEQKG